MALGWRFHRGYRTYTCITPAGSFWLREPLPFRVVGQQWAVWPIEHVVAVPPLRIAFFANCCFAIIFANELQYTCCSLIYAATGNRKLYTLSYFYIYRVVATAWTFAVALVKQRWNLDCFRSGGMPLPFRKSAKLEYALLMLLLVAYIFLNHTGQSGDSVEADCDFVCEALQVAFLSSQLALFVPEIVIAGVHAFGSVLTNECDVAFLFEVSSNMRERNSRVQ